MNGLKMLTNCHILERKSHKIHLLDEQRPDKTILQMKRLQSGFYFCKTTQSFGQNRSNC